MVLEVKKDGDPVLRKKAMEISKDYPNLLTFLGNLEETRVASNGIGIAAPQVGESIRVFIANVGFMIKRPEIFINPKIIELSEDSVSGIEGCLSIDGFIGEVDRANVVKIEFYDKDFNKQEKTYTGWDARVIQHEYDHLDGILFKDKAK